MRRAAEPRARSTWREIGEHTSELQSQFHLVCRLLLEKKKQALWNLREFISDTQDQEGPNIKHDVSIPISRIADFIWASDQELALAHAGVLFFFNDTATTEIYTLSLHDALPI